jgi:hypothetical protein
MNSVYARRSMHASMTQETSNITRAHMRKRTIQSMEHYQQTARLFDTRDV